MSHLITLFSEKNVCELHLSICISIYISTYIAPLQGNYSEALPAQARPKRRVNIWQLLIKKQIQAIFVKLLGYWFSCSTCVQIPGTSAMKFTEQILPFRTCQRCSYVFYSTCSTCSIVRLLWPDFILHG